MPTTTPLLHKHLTELQGKRAVVVMIDQRAFKGTVTEFDGHALFLTDVTEGGTHNSRGWEEVTLGSGFVTKRLTSRGVYSDQEPGQLVRLKDVLINLDGVLRIWEWEPENMTKPEHITLDKQGPVF